MCWEMVANQLSEKTTNACMFAINFTYKRGRKCNSQIIIKHNALYYEFQIVTGFSKNDLLIFTANKSVASLCCNRSTMSTDMNIYININVYINDNANVKQHLCMWKLQLDKLDNSFQIMEDSSFSAIHNVMSTDTTFNLHY